MKNIFVDKVEFEIVSKIAEGGMGAVYKAQQKGIRGFAKTVAIKTILEEFATDKNFVEDFISEAMLVANLIHENIVQIYQLGKYRSEYYFVLEFVDGISLYDFMSFHHRMRKRLPVELAVFIASRVARGLSYAHARKTPEGESMNIVHCDVCTHNILVNTEGVPKLTDFGIARANSRKREGTGISGKLPFVSPEQISYDMQIDFRSDIFSLGVVLFFMISGELPRRIDQTMRELVDDVRGNHILWDLLPGDVDDDLRSLLAKMMAKKPGDRYNDTAELAHDLEYYIYKNGYGPTIVTLSEYMKKTLPGVFCRDDDGSETKTISVPNSKTAPLPMDKTVVMDRSELK